MFKQDHACAYLCKTVILIAPEPQDTLWSVVGPFNVARLLFSCHNNYTCALHCAKNHYLEIYVATSALRSGSNCSGRIINIHLQECNIVGVNIPDVYFICTLLQCYRKGHILLFSELDVYDLCQLQQAGTFAFSDAFKGAI